VSPGCAPACTSHRRRSGRHGRGLVWQAPSWLQPSAFSICFGVGAAEQAVIATTAATVAAAIKSFCCIRIPFSFYRLLADAGKRNRGAANPGLQPAFGRGLGSEASPRREKGRLKAAAGGLPAHNRCRRHACSGQAKACLPIRVNRRGRRVGLEQSAHFSVYARVLLALLGHRAPSVRKRFESAEVSGKREHKKHGSKRQRPYRCDGRRAHWTFTR